VWVAAGDLDGDGRADILTGAGSGAPPHVKAFDAPGATKASFYAYPTAFTGGVRVAATDADGDNLAEVVTAPGPVAGAHIRVLDGLTLAEIAAFFAFDPAGYHLGATVGGA